MPIVQITHNLENDNIKVAYSCFGKEEYKEMGDILHNWIRMLTCSISNESFDIIQNWGYIQECKKILSETNSSYNEIMLKLKQLDNLTKLQAG